MTRAWPGIHPCADRPAAATPRSAARSARCSRIWYWRSRARSAVRTAVISVARRTGRSSSVTLPSVRTASLDSAESAPGRVRIKTGRSDHGGCDARTSREARHGAPTTRLPRGAGSPQRPGSTPAAARRTSGRSRAAIPVGDSIGLGRRGVPGGRARETAAGDRGSTRRHSCVLGTFGAVCRRPRRPARRSARRGTRAAASPTTMRPPSSRNSRIVRSCLLPRFFMTEIAWRTSPRVFEVAQQDRPRRRDSVASTGVFIWRR